MGWGQTQSKHKNTGVKVDKDIHTYIIHPHISVKNKYPLFHCITPDSILLT